jgi:hypothetical protein
MKRLFAILLACSCLAMPNEIAVHWSNLERIIGGKNVVLGLRDGKRVKGSTVSVEADSIVIQTRKARESVPRNSVREVRLPRQAGYKWRIIGTAIGAGVGLAIAVPVLTETHNEGSGRYDGAAIGLVGGLAALGYLGGWSVDKSGDLIRVLPD